MPGPVSDAYDPEWGTAANADRVRAAFQLLLLKLAARQGGLPKVNTAELCEEDNTEPVTETLTQREWQLIRCSLGWALESI